MTHSTSYDATHTTEGHPVGYYYTYIIAPKVCVMVLSSSTSVFFVFTDEPFWIISNGWRTIISTKKHFNSVPKLTIISVPRRWPPSNPITWIICLKTKIMKRYFLSSQTNSLDGQVHSAVHHFYWRLVTMDLPLPPPRPTGCISSLSASSISTFK